jgi:hypothetical protein
MKMNDLYSAFLFYMTGAEFIRTFMFYLMVFILIV